MILHTRDKACKPIDRARKSRVRLQGDADHEVCIDDIERRLIEELPDLFISQQCVPEVITFDQDKNYLIRKLKQRYDEISDSDDKKLLLAKSDLAKCLQRHVAEEAEAAVRTKIYEAARREKVPMVVLGGVKTAEHVGSHLEQFGISLTKLKSLLNPSKSEATLSSSSVLDPLELLRRSVTSWSSSGSGSSRERPSRGSVELSTRRSSTRGS